MQKYLTLLIIIIVSGCSSGHEYSTVSIVGFSDNREVIRGMGVEIDSGVILTSAHVVPDDRYLYRVGVDSYRVVDRDVGRDRAVMSRSGVGVSLSEAHLVPSIEPGEQVWSQVYRSGVLVYLTGSVIDPNGVVLGYDSAGKARSLSGIVITTLSFLPGESGAPIYNSAGELLDVVHIAREK